ncbi:TM2 domain-containing protein [Zooshikella sp. RANM57]|uniref:TM2 domain-containing protein n=1 Tax=Zooshikella sp. RANM57 TaxID=3425863 RepID=UPI003D6EBCF9
MKGKILNFDASTKTGIISGDDGKRYNFQAKDWKSASEPRATLKVDFAVNGELAIEIYADSSSSSGSSKKIAAALFAFFLGAFGAHKFYLGYTKQGVIMLLVFIFGMILLGIPSMIIGIIAFIEFVLYLTKSDEEFEQLYIIGKKPWF